MLMRAGAVFSNLILLSAGTDSCQCVSDADYIRIRAC